MFVYTGWTAVRSTRLSNRLSNTNPFDNRMDNRFDVCLHDTAGCQSGCTTGLTTCQTGLTTCQTGCTTNRLYNQFDNRLYRVNGVLGALLIFESGEAMDYTYSWGHFVISWSFGLATDERLVFLPHDAMLARYMLWSTPVSVWPSVCLSVTSRYSIKISEHKIMQPIPHNNLGSLVFCCQRRSW